MHALAHLHLFAFGNKYNNTTVPLPTSSAHTLRRACCRSRHIITHDQVDLANVQSLLTDARRHKHVILTTLYAQAQSIHTLAQVQTYLKFSDNIQLLFLCLSALWSTTSASGRLRARLSSEIDSAHTLMYVQTQ
jgi:hypothetical protein